MSAADLRGIKAALAAMTDEELDALAEATCRAPPGLLAWLDSARVWEVRHRAGEDYELQPPKAAIPPEEDAVSIVAAIELRRSFVGRSPAVCAFFDALVDLLTGSGQKH